MDCNQNNIKWTHFKHVSNNDFFTLQNNIGHISTPMVKGILECLNISQDVCS